MFLSTSRPWLWPASHVMVSKQRDQILEGASCGVCPRFTCLGPQLDPYPGPWFDVKKRMIASFHSTTFDLCADKIFSASLTTPPGSPRTVLTTKASVPSPCPWTHVPRLPGSCPAFLFPLSATFPWTMGNPCENPIKSQDGESGSHQRNIWLVKTPRPSQPNPARSSPAQPRPGVAPITKRYTNLVGKIRGEAPAGEARPDPRSRLQTPTRPHTHDEKEQKKTD